MPTATLVSTEPDGRSLRRLRSYDCAVDAVLDLIESGVSAPTAQQISERSGISIRTVFRLTDDVESLHVAAVQRQTERIAPLYQALPTEGSRSSRIGALVANRATIFEAIAPVRHVAERLAHGSRPIARGLAHNDRLLRAQVEAVFERELRTLGPTRRRDALHAANAAASWPTWDYLRGHGGLTPSGATRAVRTLLDGVLPQRGA